jgi:predicted nucleic acid-binding protein
MPLVVPDTSVVLKWVLPQARETLVEQALAVLEAFQAEAIDLVVPALWIYEAGNILALHYPALARERLDALVRLDLRVGQPDAAWRSAALDLVLAHRVSFYDAAFHALAIREGGVLVTADQRYCRKVDSPAKVCYLANWSAP